MIAVGSHVAYSVDFLHAIGAYTGPVANAQGVVTAFEQLGPYTLAIVEWPNRAVPQKVNVCNLTLIGPRFTFCVC